jgi:hypothetical protein
MQITQTSNTAEERFELSPGLTGGECLSVTGFVGAMALCTLCAIASYSHGGADELASYTRLGGYFAATGLVWALLRMVLAKEMRQSNLIVSGNTLTSVRPQRIITISLDSVRSFRYVRLWLVPAFGLVRSGEGAVRITLRTKNLEGLVSTLVARFDSLGKTDVYDKRKMDAFLRDARRSEESTGRMRMLLSRYCGSIVLACTVCMVTALYVWLFPLFLSLLWSAFALILFVNAIRAAEYLLGRRYQNSIAAPAAADSAAVAKAYFLSGCCTMVFFLCSGIELTSAILP